MIVDLEEFIRAEQPVWTEFEHLLDLLATRPAVDFDLTQVRHFHHLHQRVAAGLARIQTFSAEPQTRAYLESLVARAYSEAHETRRGHGLHPVEWLMRTLPRTFRRRFRPFLLSLAVTLAGCLFGACVLLADPELARTLLPPALGLRTPQERVRQEEDSHRTSADLTVETFMASWYMTHNTKVSIYVLALGLTWGVGTVALLFGNGFLLGMVVADYAAAGQGTFVAGWLLPHGSVEIPAILLAGQAGFVLAAALIGDGRRRTLAERLRAVSRDAVTLVLGSALMLVWAGVIEAFLSQHHEPVMSYWIKIALGLLNLALLGAYFSLCGREASR